MADRRHTGGIMVFTRNGTHPLGETSRRVIGGRLQNVATGHPLPSLTVAVTLATRLGDTIPVGTAVSDASGGFRVHAGPEEDAALRQIGQPGVTLGLRITDATGREWLTMEDVTPSFGRSWLVLELPVPPMPATTEHWADLAGRLRDREQSRLHEAVRHLVLAPADESVVSDWPIALRHSMAADIERVLIDPTGALTERKAPPTFFGVHARGEWAAYRRGVENPSDPVVTKALDRAAALYDGYPGLHRVDWEMDLDAMGSGDVVAAATDFEHMYDMGEADPHQGIAKLRDKALVPYRDYLRTLYTGANYTDEESQAKLDALENRFHQDFRTKDRFPRTANAVLAEILEGILTASTQAYGFGISPGAIEPQGNRTDREYLDHLIGLAGVSAGELGKRYRLDLGRSDAAISTPVEENIATLQGFYRDGYQSKKDPLFAVVPDANRGRAPFFLYYDEWLRRTGPFFPENYYRIADTFTCGVEPEWLPEAASEAGSNPHKGWWQKTVEAQELVAEGQAKLRQGQYRLAIDRFVEAWRLGHDALDESVEVLANETSQSPSEVWDEVRTTVPTRGAELRSHPIASEADLASFVDNVRWAGEYPTYEDQLNPINQFPSWIEDDISYRWLALTRLTAFIIPSCVADACLASGDHASAVYLYSLGTRKPVGRGPTDIVPPYRSPSDDKFGKYDSNILWRYGVLPYTVDTSTDPDPGWVPSWLRGLDGGDSSVQQRGSYWASSLHDDVLHDMEKRWFRLRQADALVQWADALYRTDEAADVARARELYKSALFVLGAKAWVSPLWGASSFSFVNGAENPALTVLTAQARKGMVQIEAGLNYYGADDSLVPHLKYRTLKEAADRYASAAKSAETDLLAYMGSIETALVEQMLHANLLQKARLQAGIAGEQAEIAEFEVGLAQRQVEAVKAEIVRKKQELEDESGLFEQFKDFVVGMKDTITGLPSGLTGFAGSGVEASAGAGGAGMTGSAALAAGAGVMAGYAVFVYAGYTSLSAVNDNLTSLKQQINALQDDALPLAQAQVQARQRQVTIADLQRQIAEADADLARDLIHFAQLRFLNVDFWSELAGLTRRTLRRYLTLGGRFAWLAERALAYEQDRALDIVRLDYVPVKHQGITGAGQLVADLVELDATRLDGIRQAIPVRRTWSLAFDFPIQFAQLKATGRCEFHTTDDAFRHAHPGTYGHRIETVRVRAQNLMGVNPFRGLVRNTGRSTMSRADDSSHLSLRFEDALALTEPGPDGWVATPGAEETLGLFEGSGVATSWVLELPAAANPYGLADLADVLFTIEGRALYSSELYDEATPPSTVQKFLAVSAAEHDQPAMAALQDPEVDAVDIEFDLVGAGLTSAAVNHSVTNAFVIFAGPGSGGGTIGVKAASEAAAITVPLAEGVALSNAGPLANGGPAEPLNALVGVAGDQSFTVSLVKADMTGIDPADVRDVVLGIEYTADLN